MAKWKTKTGLPDAISRREILAGSAKEKVDLGELGRRYLDAGWLSDAIDCFERSHDTAKLEEVKRLAIEKDVFLLARLTRIEGFEVTPQDWRQAAEKALADGRDRSAATAFDRAGDAAQAAAAREKIAALRAELKPPTRGRGGLDIA